MVEHGPGHYIRPELSKKEAREQFAQTVEELRGILGDLGVKKLLKTSRKKYKFWDAEAKAKRNKSYLKPAWGRSKRSRFRKERFAEVGLFLAAGETVRNDSDGKPLPAGPERQNVHIGVWIQQKTPTSSISIFVGECEHREQVDNYVPGRRDFIAPQIEYTLQRHLQRRSKPGK